MKRIDKGYVIAFLLGAILFGGITIVIATNIASSTVDYTTSANNNVETVEEALDDLYEQVMNYPVVCYNGVCGKISYKYWNNNFPTYGDLNPFDSSHMPTGSGLNGVFDSSQELITAVGTAYANSTIGFEFTSVPFYIRSVLIDGKVVSHEACIWYNDREFCLAPPYQAGSLDNTTGTNRKIKLIREIETSLNITLDVSKCLTAWTSANCGFRNDNYNGNYITISVSTDNRVGCNTTINDANHGCFVTEDLHAYCF